MGKEPIRINRGHVEDHRGSVEFYNDVDLDNYKRFYIVRNPLKGTVRAWHGHKKEAKLIKVISGSFLIGAVKIDNWNLPSKDLNIELFDVDFESGLIYIPPGYANGAMNLNEESSAIYFSTSNLNESLEDDYRFEAKYWDPWTEEGGVIFE